MTFGFAMPNPRNGAACGLAQVLAILTLAAGCTQAKLPDRVEPTLVDLSLVDRAAFDAVLARFQGHVVLVDCWATWCSPCVEQLPHSLDLARQHRDAGLEVVTLNFDDPEAADAAITILKKSGAPVAHTTHLQTRFGGSTESMDAFEIASGALPHYQLYDRQGKLRKVFELDPAADKRFTPADIDAAVEELLAEH